MTTLKDYENSWSKEDVKREIEKTRGEKVEESPFLSIKPDTEVVVRVLPRPGGGSPFVKFAKHFFKDPQTDKFISFSCPSKSKLAGFHTYECPVCKTAANLRRSSIKRERDMGYSMRAKPRALVNLILRPDDAAVQSALDDGVPPPQGEVKLWEISSWYGDQNGKNLHEEVLALRTSRAGGDYTNPTEDGFDLLIVRTGSGMDTAYKVHVLTSDKKPLHPDEKEAVRIIEEDQIDLTWFITPPTPEELSAILQGESKKRSHRSLPPKSAKGEVTAGDLVDDNYGEAGETGAGF